MAKQIISTTAAPEALGPYSQAVKAGGFLFVSGQLPINPANGKLLSSTIEAETELVLKNLETIIIAAGAELADVVKTTVFITNMDDFPRVNEVYAGFFSAAPPARACIEVARLPKDARIEVEAVVALGC